MRANLLATKLYQPSLPPRRVQRPRLLQRLNEGLAAGCQLTLISAPAGFGKTNCASEWAAHSALPVAWLSLDPSDDDPQRFFRYFVAALQAVDGNMGRELDAVLDSGQLPPPETITATLTNSILGTPHKFLCVLDDFHVIQDRTILAALETLIAHLPPQLHLALVTREDPLLPLARLRASRQITEIRSADLRFSSQEAGSFMKEMMGLALSEGDLALLEERTEGWIAGLQLAGLSMQGREDLSNFIANLRGTQRFILNYLMDEVLGRQNGEIQVFLLQTSILEGLNGDLCDAVTGRSDSSQVLERLFTANLFLIPLDDEGHWYRFHHLFLDLLRNQQNRLPKENLLALHRRACRWFEGAGMPGDAIEHALAARDYGHVVDLLELNAMPMVSQGDFRTLEGWMKALPPEWQASSPKANLAVALIHLIHGNYERVATYLAQADVPISRANVSDAKTIAMRAEWLAIRSNLYNVEGNSAEGLASARQALLDLPPENYSMRSVAYIGLGGAYRLAGDFTNLVAAYKLAIQNSEVAGNLMAKMIAVVALTLTATQNGRLNQAYEAGYEFIDWIERSGSPALPVLGTVYASVSLACYEWNQLEKGRAYILRSLQLNRLIGHNAGQAYAKIILARLQLAEADLENAGKSIQESAELTRLGIPAWLKPEIVAQQVRVYLALANPTSAEAVLRQHGLCLEDNMPVPERIVYPDELLLVACLRWLLYRAREMSLPVDLESGIKLAGLIIAKEIEEGRLGITLEALLLRAQLQSALGQKEAGMDDVCQALRLAEPEGFVRLFVDEGPEMAALLKRSLEGNVPREYLKRLLMAFPPTKTGVESIPAGPELAEPLTERELEVMRLISQGLKYSEIAARLFITVNTVRFYVKEIYGKLNVNNRTQAIETARQLGVL